MRLRGGVCVCMLIAAVIAPSAFGQGGQVGTAGQVERVVRVGAAGQGAQVGAAGQIARVAQVGPAGQVEQAAPVRRSGQVRPSGLAVIDGCLAHLDPQSGSDGIAVRCPDLVRKLAASDAGAWLPAGWAAPDNDLSVGSLTDLRQLIAHQLSLRASAHPPDLNALKSILIELGPTQTPSAWSRFMRWLREALERGEPGPASSWWNIDSAGPSQTVIDFICYAGLAAVVIMALALILNELRVAGAFARGPDRIARDVRRTPMATALDWSTIQNAPTRDRPRLLLELIAARLIELDRLPPARGFTVRELMQQVRLSEGEDRSLLADVAFAAERVRFSAEQIAAASLQTVIERGRRLLEHLSS